MWHLLLVVSFTALISCVVCETVQDTGKPCTYFGGARVSKNENNLVNCSWYANNACCKRTEVTSVFGGMYPLYGATEECKNQVNYLMCYFCSPEQYMWYDKKAYVCSGYCDSLYEHCKTAGYDGQVLGNVYASGQDFCLAQKFEVVDSNERCFDFDPDVFGEAPYLTVTLALAPIIIVSKILACVMTS